MTVNNGSDKKENRPVLSSERAPHKGKTVTVEK
jgi:hypothetical protein